MMRSIIIGRARIPLNEIAAAGDKGYIRTLPLLGESYNFSEKSLGEISIVANWVYDAATEENLKSAGRSSRSVFAKLSTLFTSKKKMKSDGDDEVCFHLKYYLINPLCTLSS